METLRQAYALAEENDGAPGIDGVTFEVIEAQGIDAFLEQIRDELVGRTYKPLPARRREIPKDGGKVRVLSIPAIRDRVVQGALKLILEPIFEADFQPGSFGYRPKKTAHEAIDRRRGAWRVQYTPKLKKRTALLRKLKVVFRRLRMRRKSNPK
jgi:RNA-directed DNA polymerase